MLTTDEVERQVRRLRTPASKRTRYRDLLSRATRDADYLPWGEMEAVISHCRSQIARLEREHTSLRWQA